MTLRNKKILFVDDNQISLETRKEYLESLNEGYLVLTARSTAEAREQLTRNWVHLIIADQRMKKEEPDNIDGLLFLEETDEQIAKMIITNYPDWQMTRRALRQLGKSPPTAYEYVYKKDGLEVFRQAIEQVFQNKVLTNWDLVIDWQGRPEIHWASLLEPEQPRDLLLPRSEELEDLIRRVYHAQRHLRIGELVWQKAGRLALTARTEEMDGSHRTCLLVLETKTPEITLADLRDAFKSKFRGAAANWPYQLVATKNFSAFSMSLPGAKMARLESLYRCWQANADKARRVLGTLVSDLLPGWHLDRPRSIRLESGGGLAAFYRDLLGLNRATGSEDISNLFALVAAEAATLPYQPAISRDGMQLHFQLARDRFAYADPIHLLHAGLELDLPLVAFDVPGELTGENILVDQDENVWLTDFRLAGDAPVMWNFVNLEATVRYDWTETLNLGHIREFESALSLKDFLALNRNEVSGDLPKALRMIIEIRTLAYQDVNFDERCYHLGLFFMAADRLQALRLSAASMTRHELARAAHLLLSMSMLGTSLAKQPDRAAGRAGPPKPKLYMDFEKREVWLNKERITLTHQDYELLKYLYERAGEVCTRQEIVASVFGQKLDQAENRRLNTAISRLRAKIEPFAGTPRLLIRVPRVGYRLDIERPKAQQP